MDIGDIAMGVQKAILDATVKEGITGNTRGTIRAGMQAAVAYLSKAEMNGTSFMNALANAAAQKSWEIEDGHTLTASDPLVKNLGTIRTAIDIGLSGAGVDLNSTKAQEVINDAVREIPEAMKFGRGSNQDIVQSAVNTVHNALMH